MSLFHTEDIILVHKKIREQDEPYFLLTGRILGESQTEDGQTVWPVELWSHAGNNPDWVVPVYFHVCILEESLMLVRRKPV
jgi:hypothetical protein